MQPSRVRFLSEKPVTAGPVVYWMQRDHRVKDNWAFEYAKHQAKQRNQPLVIVFALLRDLSTHHGTERLIDFMFAGLEEVEHEAHSLSVPFFLLLTVRQPNDAVAEFAQHHHAGCVVTDFSPLKGPRTWKKSLISQLNVPLIEVDAHNIVPCWEVSDKREFAAYTFRPKVQKKLDMYLDVFPRARPVAQSYTSKTYRSDYTQIFSHPINWKKARQQMKIDPTVPAIDWLKAGSTAGAKMLDRFLQEKLSHYATHRNDPNANVLSCLSPYLHFGHLSAQRVVRETYRQVKKEKERDAFIEELVVRRELADNFCWYTPNYESFEAFPEWAKHTLNMHRDDTRDFVYSRTEFEQAKTHDRLWNAAQLQMVQTGKMHGYLRMYWAKKILEWTASPEDAIAIAIWLNDRYELDGRDPNGYTGIAWSIGGVHDRPWFDRPVYGKIRYMNANGAAKKFSVDTFIKQFIGV